MVLNGWRIFFYRRCGYNIGKNVFIGMRCYLDDLEPKMFTVEDDGCGIDEEKISRILEGGTVSFGESGDSKTRHAGIGLSV